VRFPLPRFNLVRRSAWGFFACLSLASVLILGIGVGRVHAQAVPALESLEIALWPEFDKPSMLVIYRANLPASTILPANVSLPIPDGVEPNAVAQQEADGRLVDVNYSLNQENGYATVNVLTASQQIQVEYYADLSIDGTARSFTLLWPGGVSIGSMNLEVQDPPAISNLTISPASTDEIVGEYGLTYKRANLGAVGPTDRPLLQVNYTKVGEGLTVDTLQATPPSQTEPAVGAAPEPTKVVIWVAAAVVAILVVVSGILYFRVWRTPVREKPARPRHPPSTRKAAFMPTVMESSAPAGSVFCHKCGEQAGPGDRFCRTCGTRLRT
jgi:hypothetical protein